jgi:hypothetical protein
MTITFVHTGACFSFFVLFFVSPVWFFLWLPEEVLALLFLLHHENGDFSILMKDIMTITVVQTTPEFLGVLNFFPPFVRVRVSSLLDLKYSITLLLDHLST